MKRSTIEWDQYIAGLAGGLYGKPDAEYTRLRVKARQLRSLVSHVSTYGCKKETAVYRHQTKLRRQFQAAAKRAEAEFDAYAISIGVPNVKPWKPRNWTAVKAAARRADFAYRPRRRNAA
jgi:hypothetical protein